MFPPSRGDRGVGINNGGYLKDLIGTVPYLNGGLFEQDEEDKDAKIIIPDDCIDSILHDLFQRFAFTVTESTPLDVEVAVDPEMLGKVFEELVTGRHESGSYYTPKPIVSFMCRESLKGYLKTQVAEESKEAIAELVDEQNSEKISNLDEVLEAFKKVKTCDLACGSGAYLLGMLHELLDLRKCLFEAKGIDCNTVYQHKLEIIENNLYGVDIDIFAVNIARLRLWLSLAVDYQGDRPQPLPNLKYKIQVGDSLISPNPKKKALRDGFIEKLREAKAKYLRSHNGNEKKQLEAEITQLKKDISLMTYGKITPSRGDIGGLYFDWGLDFADVFADGGFDIIVANPPYVRQELIKHLKPKLKEIYPQVYTGTADLYCFFYARALELLNKGGMLAFISSNKWFKAKYGEKLRKHIADTCQVQSITDFGDLPVFKSATTYPTIFIAEQTKLGKNLINYTKVKSLDAPYPNVKEIIEFNKEVMPNSALDGSNWLLTDTSSLFRLQKMKAIGIPLIEYIDKKIYVGLKTGCNKAFWIDDIVREELIKRNKNNQEIINQLIVGKDINKWNINYQSRYLITTKIGTNINKYPLVLDYLTQWKDTLKTRSDQGNYWWELRKCKYYTAFDKPKIVFPDIALEPRFALDTTGAYADMTSFIIPLNDLYLLGILNSSPVYKYFLEIGAQVRGGYLRFKRQYVEQIPIPPASDFEKEAISKLVKKCLDAKGVNCEKWEKEIDDRVAALYGL
ncbi:MAG: Eco57I restriction-modification methylase domain-containing protein [Prochloraceae cyanobacterium]